MATKQELEVQVDALQAELDQLKSASPDGAAAAELENVRQELATVIASMQVQVDDLNAALGVKNAELKRLQAENAKLASLPVSDSLSGREVLFRGTVKAAMEHFKRQFCHENDEAVILKEK